VSTGVERGTPKHTFGLAGNAEPAQHEAEIGFYPGNADWNVCTAGELMSV
jgi:hypothetical protein